MSRSIVQGFLATSHPIAAYGGIALAAGALESIRTELLSGSVRMQAEHDPRRRMDIQVLQAEMRPTDDGHNGVWVTLSIDDEHWAVQGGLRGLSFTALVPLRQAADTPSDLPALRIGADAAQFDERALDDAADALARVFRVSTCQVYQFNAFPPPTVLVEVTLSILLMLSSGLLVNALYDTLKAYFLHPKNAEASRITFTLSEGRRRLDATVETSDPDILRTAMEGLASLQDSPSQSHDYKPGKGWVAVDPESSP